MAIKGLPKFKQCRGYWECSNFDPNNRANKTATAYGISKSIAFKNWKDLMSGKKSSNETKESWRRN